VDHPHKIAGIAIDARAIAVATAIDKAVRDKPLRHPRLSN
jgi:hypothetical protein